MKILVGPDLSYILPLAVVSTCRWAAPNWAAALRTVLPPVVRIYRYGFYIRFKKIIKASMVNAFFHFVFPYLQMCIVNTITAIFSKT